MKKELAPKKEKISKNRGENTSQTEKKKLSKAEKKKDEEGESRGLEEAERVMAVMMRKRTQTLVQSSTPYRQLISIVWH